MRKDDFSVIAIRPVIHYSLTLSQVSVAETGQVDGVEAMTPRELEVLRLMAEGFPNSQIGERLFLTEGTVKFHVHNILGKIQVKNRSQAILQAKKLKLI